MIPLLVTLYRFGRSVRLAFKDPQFEAMFTLLVIIIGSGTVFYHDIEGWGWLDSYYFSVITITTVGFGDLTPHTDIGKIFTTIYLLVGIGILLGFVNLIAHHTVSETVDKPFFPRKLWFVNTKGEEEDDEV